MTKIAFLVSTLEGFGLVKVLFYLAKYLKRNPQFEIYMITLSDEPTNSMLNDFLKEGIKVKSIHMSRLKGLFFAQKALISLLNDLQIDILHSNGFRANLIHHQIKRQIPNVKEVMTIHLDPNHDAKHLLGPLFSLWRKKKHIAIIKNCKRAVACSKSISEELKKYDIHIPFIQNGIDTEILLKNHSSIDKKSFDFQVGEPVSIVLSGLHERKNIDTIIQAFNILGNHFPLLIIGDGPDRERLEKLSQGTHIHFLGYQKDIFRYFQIADLYLSASYSDGLPMSVMEAMSVGVIPILSNISPHNEIVENSIFEQYTFEYKDVSAIVKHCQSIQKLDLSPLKKEAKQIIDNHFTANRMAQEYSDLYNKN